MSEMVERAARAAYEENFNGDWPETGCSLDADRFRNAAKAAIQAMREPTVAMIEAAMWQDGERTARIVWEAMIDAALQK